MRSSSDKRRDMARSILPSTSRGSRARITAAKRDNRRRIARHLAVANGVPDWDDVADVADLRAYPDAVIGGHVRRRRAADKLNHFERWAVRSTRDLPQGERLDALRARLPAGLIGDHALSHLRDLPELDPSGGVNPGFRAALYARIAADRAARAERTAREAARRRALLVEAVTTHGRHGELNRAMKAAALGDPPAWRTLADVADVDAFLADVGRVPSWRAALAGFLGEPVTPAR